MQTLAKLSKPKSQTAVILRALIKRTRGISERGFPYNGFRSRLSDLRDLGLNIRHVVRHYKNSLNHPSYYRVHFLRESDKAGAVKIYEKLNK
jgi:hypothetical protein